MAASAETSLLLLLLVFSFVFVQVDCKSSSLGLETHDFSTLRSQLDELKSKVSSLESIIERKEGIIQYLETIIREKSDDVASLQRENDLLQEQLSNGKLEPASTSKKLSLGYAEGLLHSLSVYSSQAQGYALALIRSLSVILSRAQQIVVTQWNHHLLPALKESIPMAMKIKDRVVNWFQPHIESLHAKLLPTLKYILKTFTTFLGRQVHSLALNMADGYIQVAKKHVDPYIDQVVTLTKPHLDKACKTTCQAHLSEKEGGKAQ